MDARRKQLVDFWDDQAARFDAQVALVERWFLGPARRWVAERVVGHTLEVAVGTGLNLPHYAPGVDLTGIEWSPKMLAAATVRAQSLGLDPELHLGDAMALPFPDESFDTVVCTFSLCCIPDERAALAEARRVLRPGGRLLIADHVVSSVAPVRWLQRLAERFSIPAAEEHWTRRPRLALEGLGLDVVESDRRTWGVFERVHARRAAGPPA